MTYRWCFFMLMTSITICLAAPVMAQNSQSDNENQGRNLSPNQQRVNKESVDGGGNSLTKPTPHQGVFPDEFRTIDGTYNNLLNHKWGSANIELLRLTTIGYADGVDSPSGENRPNVRVISNIVAHQGNNNISYKRGYKYSDLFWQWGQFLDHDIDLTPVEEPIQPLDITVPRGDKFFDPKGTGVQTIALERSLYRVVEGVRQQINKITSYIDASNVYGSDSRRARVLRTLDGTGRMKTSKGNLLPYNKEGLPNAAPHGTNPEKFFLAGDFRANEQVGLTAMHTLFVREHNFWAKLFRRGNPTLSGDELYERARAMVGAEMQHITYNEFLPLLLGGKALPPYRGYQPTVNPGISNVFATAGYRFGHSMVSSKLLRLKKNGQSLGDLSLRKAFFNPKLIVRDGIEPYLRGLASQVVQRYDIYMVNNLRNFLFGKPGKGGFDLASLNLQRGRDHGLPNYNQVRQDFGLPPVKNFGQISSKSRVRKRLRAAYQNVNDMDIWIAGLAEDPVKGAVVGKTNLAILKDQFERLRDGDRFWFENYLPSYLIKVVKSQTLAKIIRRNTKIRNEIPKKAFLVH